MYSECYMYKAVQIHSLAELQCSVSKKNKSFTVTLLFFKQVFILDPYFYSDHKNTFFLDQ